MFIMHSVYPKSLYPSSQTNVALMPSRTSLALTGTGGWPQLLSSGKIKTYSILYFTVSTTGEYKRTKYARMLYAVSTVHYNTYEMIMIIWLQICTNLCNVFNLFLYFCSTNICFLSGKPDKCCAMYSLQSFFFFAGRAREENIYVS